MAFSTKLMKVNFAVDRRDFQLLNWHLFFRNHGPVRKDESFGPNAYRTSVKEAQDPHFQSNDQNVGHYRRLSQLQGNFAKKKRPSENNSLNEFFRFFAEIDLFKARRVYGLRGPSRKH